MAFDKEPKITFSILKEAEMDKTITEILAKYKGSDFSTEELNLRVEVDKVFYVLSRCLAKLELLAKLPNILENEASVLKNNFKIFEAYFILDVLNSHGAKFTNELHENIDYKEFTQSLRSLLQETGKKNSLQIDKFLMVDPMVDQIIDMIFYNKCIKSVLLTISNEKSDLGVMKFMKKFQQFKNVLKEKLYISGDKQIQIDKMLRNAYKTVTLQTGAIKELEEQLDKQRKELGDQLRSKVEVFEMYKRKMKNVQDDLIIKVNHERHESEKRMMHVSLKSEEYQAELSEQANKITREYELLLEDNLSKEKMSRAKRMKLEAQLQNWLATFDQDIGERQTQYEVLHKEYTEKKEALEDYQKKIEDQEDEYDTLMEEKRIEEERIFNEMAYQFLMNRSARVIQRSWRTYREARHAKKRGRKAKRAAPRK